MMCDSKYLQQFDLDVMHRLKWFVLFGLHVCEQ
jgi:hypothetical protein